MNSRTSLKSLKSHALAGVLILFLSTGVYGATITVTNTNDAGAGSFRQAIINAEATTASDSIVFAAGVEGTITLATSLPQIENPVGIIGPGADKLAIDANGGSFRVLSFFGDPGNNLSAFLSGLTLTGGNYYFGGGGLSLGYTDLTVIDCEITGNQASNGGGITMCSYSSLTLIRCAVTNNTAERYGGGLDIAGNVTFTNVTVSGNTAGEGGGGMMVTSDYGQLYATNATITDNTVDAPAPDDPGGGGIYHVRGTVSLKNTILAGNTDNSGQAPDADGTIGTQGYNILGDNTGCTFSSTTGDLVGTGASPIDPRLKPLARNSGTTRSHALKSNSPAVDAGNDAFAPTTDQRSTARPMGKASDIGAYERIPFSPGWLYLLLSE